LYHHKSWVGILFESLSLFEPLGAADFADFRAGQVAPANPGCFKVFVTGRR
jgi:hypothetical protein